VALLQLCLQHRDLLPGGADFRLGLEDIGIGAENLLLRLGDLALRVQMRLPDRQMALLQLCLQHRDLFLPERAWASACASVKRACSSRASTWAASIRAMTCPVWTVSPPAR